MFQLHGINFLSPLLKGFGWMNEYLTTPQQKKNLIGYWVSPEGTDVFLICPEIIKTLLF